MLRHAWRSIRFLVRMGMVFLLARRPQPIEVQIHNPPQNPLPQVSPPPARWRETWLPFFLSLVVAVSSIGGSIWLEDRRDIRDDDLARYQVTFIEKQKAYALFLESVNLVWNDASDRLAGISITEFDITTSIAKLDTAFYALQPFLTAPTINDVYSHVLVFETKMLQIVQLKQEDITDQERQNDNTIYANAIEYFRQVLLTAMFPDVAG